MGEMKSAWEKAMEKAEKLGKPSDDELKQLEYVPAGNTLAARYLQEDNIKLRCNLWLERLPRGSGSGRQSKLSVYESYYLTRCQDIAISKGQLDDFIGKEDKRQS